MKQLLGIAAIMVLTVGAMAAGAGIYKWTTAAPAPEPAPAPAPAFTAEEVIALAEAWENGGRRYTVTPSCFASSDMKEDRMLKTSASYKPNGIWLITAHESYSTSGGEKLHEQKCTYRLDDSTGEVLLPFKLPSQS